MKVLKYLEFAKKENINLLVYNGKQELVSVETTILDGHYKDIEGNNFYITIEFGVDLPGEYSVKRKFPYEFLSFHLTMEYFRGILLLSKEHSIKTTDIKTAEYLKELISKKLSQRFDFVGMYTTYDIIDTDIIREIEEFMYPSSEEFMIYASPVPKFSTEFKSFEKKIKIKNIVNESIKLDTSGYKEVYENLTILDDALLASIKAKQLDIKEVFDIDGGNIEGLSKDPEFANNLLKNSLRPSDIIDTDDFQTFLKNRMKFMFIYHMDSSDLDEPVYVFIQKGNSTKLYEINDRVQNFYDKLISKTIEIEYRGKKYLYNISNANEWVLQNTENKSSIFKEVIRSEELSDIIKNRKIKIEII